MQDRRNAVKNNGTKADYDPVTMTISTQNNQSKYQEGLKPQGVYS